MLEQPLLQQRPLDVLPSLRLQYSDLFSFRTAAKHLGLMEDCKVSGDFIVLFHYVSVLIAASYIDHRARILDIIIATVNEQAKFSIPVSIDYSIFSRSRHRGEITVG